MLDIIRAKAQPAERYDLFGAIHRGMRKTETELLARLGALDAASDAAVKAVAADFRRFAVLARFQLADEQDYVHGALDAIVPGATVGYAIAHEKLANALVELEAMLATLETARGQSRRIAAKALYLATSRYVADDFAHMLEEELMLEPTLQAVFSDRELAQMGAKILTRVPGPVLLDLVRITMPAIDPEARQGMMAEMMARLPAEAFHMVLDLAVKPVLSEAEWRRLDRGLREAA